MTLLLWETTFYDTLSGDRLATVKHDRGGWSTSLARIGDGTTSFRLDSSPFDRASWRSFTRPRARTIVVTLNGYVMHAGIIMRREWNPRTKVLTLSHYEVRRLLADRLTTGWQGYGTGPMDITNLSAVGVINWLINIGLAVGNETWVLPINQPEYSEAGGVNITWYPDQFKTIEDAVADFEVRLDAGNVWLQPSITARGTLEWILRLGHPLLEGAQIRLPMNTAQPIPRDVTVIEDASEQITGAYVIGEGTEVDQMFGFAGTPFDEFSIPNADRAVSMKSTGDQDTLDVAASGMLRDHRSPTEQTSIKVPASAFPDPSILVPGLRVTLEWTKDLWVEDGPQSMYVIGVAGDYTDSITLEVQPL